MIAPRMSWLALGLAVILVVGLSGGVGAQGTAIPPAGSTERLLSALSRVPIDASLGSTVSYLDQAAVAAARPGAREPASIAELGALLDAGDVPTPLWWAAMQGVSSGDPDLLQRLAGAKEWPERVGFDVLDVEAQLAFGVPPSDGSVLLGSFDPEAVADAFAERGYVSRAVHDRLELCGPDGCEEGLAVDLASADPSLPFGGHLGRREPLVVGATDILSSADLGTLTAMRDAAEGVSGSLAEDPRYRALASVLDSGPGPRPTLIQATFLPGGMLGLGPDIFRLFSDSPAAASDRLLELDAAFEPMPAAEAVAILDAATADEQRVSIALAYADEADAALAAEVLPRRLASLPTLSDGPLADLLAERGATVVSSRVVPPGSGTTAAAVVELAAPLAGDEPDESGHLEASSQLYRLFVDLVLRNDLLWLVPVLPLE